MEKHFAAPAPCIQPVEKPPFYAMEVTYSSVGTFSGLVINENGQVKTVRDEVIPGLYACPNTAAHLAVGRGYISGQVHGQSMVFGYRAALHATGG